MPAIIVKVQLGGKHCARLSEVIVSVRR